MTKEIDWKDIVDHTSEDINMEVVTSGEKDIRQSVVTSDEIPVQEANEQTSDNVIATCNILSIVSKFGSVFETYDRFEAHTFAEIFPDATQAEVDNLYEAMKEQGQYDPVIIFEGKIADGRTRKKVQDKLQRPTLAHEWLGEPEDLLNYLYAKSQHRHLTSQQRAVIALQFVESERKLAQQRRGMRTDLQHIVNAIKTNEKQKVKDKVKDKGRALDHVAKKMGTNRTYIGQAEYVQTKAKELLDHVKRNEITLSNAKLLAQRLDKPEDRQIAIQQYKNGQGKMQTIIDEILYGKDPAHEFSKGEPKSKPNSNISRKIVFAMKISESVLEEIKDVLYRHGYSEETYQILIATNAKEATEWIDPLLEGENVSTTTYEVASETKIQPIDL